MKSISATTALKTEGIKYAGSKLKLIPHILRLAEKTGASSCFDGFSGTTRVSQAFAQTGFDVTSNDTAIWSKTFAECYLLNKREPDYFEPLIDHLNSLEGKDGWFTKNYGGSGNSDISSTNDGFKKPFQNHNMRKLDAIREEIDQLPIDPIDTSVLLTSLVLALDRVDSTLGHFASYLNRWSERSFRELTLKMPACINQTGNHTVKHGDAIKTASEVESELAYYDPPYGSNNEKMPPSRVRYNSYYHFWSTVILNDKPETFGKAKRREDSSDTVSPSVFEEFRKNESGRFKAVEAIEKLLSKTNASHIIMSYSSRGRATAEELLDVFETAGSIVEFVKIDYKTNVMADMSWTNDWICEDRKKNQEYLFLIKKR
jgi:adenine-specific DNA-methyltransferase